MKKVHTVFLTAVERKDAWEEWSSWMDVGDFMKVCDGKVMHWLRVGLKCSDYIIGVVVSKDGSGFLKRDPNDTFELDELSEGEAVKVFPKNVYLFCKEDYFDQACKAQKG